MYHSYIRGHVFDFVCLQVADEMPFNVFGPVSYTHLDVYKRQIFTYFRNPYFIGVLGTVHLLDEQFVAARNEDVYKRQAFILVVAALVQMVEIILKKVSPALYQALGVFLPLITTNCCILGLSLIHIFVESV